VYGAGRVAVAQILAPMRQDLADIVARRAAPRRRASAISPLPLSS
jgi:hypothetical protein